MAANKKKVIKRRRERKHIEKGAAHIRSSFNNTMVTITDLNGNADFLGFLRRPGLPWFQKVHALCRPDGRRDRCQGCYGAWPQDRGSVCEGSWPGP